MDKIYAKFKTEKWNNILTFTVACVGLVGFVLMINMSWLLYG